MPNTENTTFGKVLGQDLQEIKMNLAKVIDKASAPTNVDVELRNILLLKRDSFLNWLKPLLQDDTYILTQQDKDLINRSLFDYDIIQAIKRDSEFPYIKKLISKNLQFILHTNIQFHFPTQYLFILEEQHGNKNVFELKKVLENIIYSEESTFDGVNFSIELFEWFGSKLGYAYLNTCFKNWINNNPIPFKKNRSLIRVLFYFSSIREDYRVNWINKLIGGNEEIFMQYPLMQISFESLNPRDNIINEQNSKLVNIIRSNPLYKMSDNYWGWDSGDYSFKDFYFGETNYASLDKRIKYVNDMYEKLNDVEFQRIFDVGVDRNDMYFLPLFGFFFPVQGYDDLWSIANLTNNKQPITNYAKAYESVLSAKNTRLNQSYKDRIKVQLDSLPEMLKYLRNDSPYLNRIKKVFEIDNLEKANLKRYWYRLSYERHYGLSWIYLFMMDSGEYTEFFKLITDIPGIAEEMYGYVNTAKSNSSYSVYLYTFIPWIATNRLNRLSLYLPELETLPLFQTLKQNITSSDFNNYWVMSYVVNAINGTITISDQVKQAIKKIPNYRERFLNNVDPIRSLQLQLIDSIELNENQKNEFKGLVNGNVPNVITYDFITKANYRNDLNLALTSREGIAKTLFDTNILTLNNFNLDIVQLVKNKELRYSQANLLKTLAPSTNIIYKKVKNDTKNWKYITYYGDDSSNNVYGRLKDNSNNFKKPIIAFISLGNYSNSDPNSVLSYVMAPENANDNSTSFLNRSNYNNYNKVVANNNGIRPDSLQKIESKLDAVWFGELYGGEWGDGYIGTIIYEYIGS